MNGKRLVGAEEMRVNEGAIWFAPFHLRQDDAVKCAESGHYILFLAVLRTQQYSLKLGRKLVLLSTAHREGARN